MSGARLSDSEGRALRPWPALRALFPGRLGASACRGLLGSPASGAARPLVCWLSHRLRPSSRFLWRHSSSCGSCLVLCLRLTSSGRAAGVTGVSWTSEPSSAAASASCSTNIKLQIGPRSQGLISIRNLWPLMDLIKLYRACLPLMGVQVNRLKTLSLHFPTRIAFMRPMEPMTENKENSALLISSSKKFLSATSCPRASLFPP